MKVADVMNILIKLQRSTHHVLTPECFNSVVIRTIANIPVGSRSQRHRDDFIDRYSCKRNPKDWTDEAAAAWVHRLTVCSIYELVLNWDSRPTCWCHDWCRQPLLWTDAGSNSAMLHDNVAPSPIALEWSKNGWRTTIDRSSIIHRADIGD
jgi:hypothetical protein